MILSGHVGGASANTSYPLSAHINDESDLKQKSTKTQATLRTKSRRKRARQKVEAGMQPAKRDFRVGKCSLLD